MNTYRQYNRNYIRLRICLHYPCTLSLSVRPDLKSWNAPLYPLNGTDRPRVATLRADVHERHADAGAAAADRTGQAGLARWDGWPGLRQVARGAGGGLSPQSEHCEALA